MASQIDAKTARLPHIGRSEDEGDVIRGAWEKNEKKFSSKRSSEYHDPCQDFANRSIRCLHRNGGDKDMCQDYFQAYRDCKKEWTTKRRLGFTAALTTRDKSVEEGAS